MSAIKEDTNLLIDQEEVYVIRLSNSLSTEAVLTNYGGIILSFRVSETDIVLGFDRVEDYLSEAYLSKSPHFGAIIGRYANRIKDARFKLDGETYQLAVNKGLDHLHGGNRGFDRVVWELKSIDDASNSVTLSYLSKDGEEGYPGNLEVQVTFTLTEENELVLEFSAAADAPTPLNLTHHGYFNLNGTRSSPGKIHDHWLSMDADAYLEQDDNLVVTGNLVPVADSYHDFRELKRVGEHMDILGEYDQTFVLNKKPRESGRAALLENRENGLRMEVFTDQPVCHFYTGRWIPVLKGKNGVEYGPFSGLCLETQQHPNSVNIPHFPGTILRPGEQYRQKTSFKVSRG